MEDIFLLHAEYVAVGLSISSCDFDGNVELLEPDINNLVPLVFSAFNKPLTSPECLTLKNAITNDLWQAYVNCINIPIQAVRELRYKNECDALYLSIVEKSIITNTTPDFTPWIQLKEDIRKSLPYYEE